MRSFIDLIEHSPLVERDQYFGIAYWVSPSGNITEADGEHADWVRAHAQFLGLDDSQVATDDDAVYYAIQKGWTRVVVQSTFTGISAKDMNAVHKAVRSLVRNKMVERTTNLEIDLYGDDPYHPDYRSFKSPNEAMMAEGKVTLYTDPNYFGAEVDDTGFSSLPIVNIPTNKLVGFEPDKKMNDPKSQANVKKIIAGLEKGDPIPPILVRHYKGGFQVLDGHHRFWAFKLLKKAAIPARIVPDHDIEEVKKVSESSLEQKDTAIYKGKNFWSGVFDTSDGHIREVHSYKKAKDNDFHHSMYVSPQSQDAMKHGEAGFFWVADGEIHTEWRDSEAPKAIVDAIRDQITFIEKEALGETLKKVHGKWALVSRKDPHKVLQYYHGPEGQKPSQEWVDKVESRIRAFSGMSEDVTLDEFITEDLKGWQKAVLGAGMTAAATAGMLHQIDKNNPAAPTHQVQQHDAIGDMINAQSAEPNRFVRTAVDAPVPPARPKVTAPDPATAAEKEAFVSKMLPMIRVENHKLVELRKHVQGLMKKKTLTPAERDEVEALMKRYRVEDGDLRKLEAKINIIPPSLVLAQSAVESGWGKSRLAQDGNVMFGQKTTGDKAVSAAEDGTRYAAFDDPSHAVASYMHNLNSHPAYKEFRQARNSMLNKGQKVHGHQLAPFLTKYSSRGEDYADQIKNLIHGAGFTKFDG